VLLKVTDTHSMTSSLRHRVASCCSFRAADEFVVVFRRRMYEDLYGRILHQRSVWSRPQHSLQT